MRRREFIAGLGGAAAWSLAVRAQQAAMPMVGYLSGVLETPLLNMAFRQGIGEQGYIEGRNLEILYRSAEGYYERLPELAADLVKHRVDLIFASIPASASLAAKSATATIPIVFALGSDPVETGLVASLGHPGGNVTGVSFLVIALVAKRLEVLRQIAPTTPSIGFLINPTNSTTAAQMKEADAAAKLLGLRLIPLEARTPGEIEAAFETLVTRQIGGLLEGSDALFFNQRLQISGLAARHAVPAIYDVREFADAGGLMSYGPSVVDAYRLAGTYAGRVLKGEKPADLPVQQSTKVELIINMKAAKALGLTFPITLLGRADEVIE